MEEKTPLQIVKDIFTEYYTEENIDFQEGDPITVLVRFPSVKVTNENDRSIDIKELYVKIIIKPNGLLSGTFTLNRTEYTYNQFVCNYLHSHVNGIGTSSEFRVPCLGQGPIRSTCSSLNTRFDENLWRLFVFELDKYVHTESLVGVPYKRLEDVGKTSSSYVQGIDSLLCIEASSMNESVISGFIPYLINYFPFRFNFINEVWGIADSYYRAVIKMSEVFIDYANENLSNDEIHNLFNRSILIRCNNEGDKFYIRTISGQGRDLSGVIGEDCFVFKGNTLKLKITDIQNGDNRIKSMNPLTILSPKVVVSIIIRILKIVNHKYGHQYTANQEFKYI